MATTLARIKKLLMYMIEPTTDNEAKFGFEPAASIQMSARKSFEFFYRYSGGGAFYLIPNQPSGEWLSSTEGRWVVRRELLTLAEIDNPTLDEQRLVSPQAMYYRDILYFESVDDAAMFRIKFL
jgi:hypothetical protein